MRPPGKRGSPEERFEKAQRYLAEAGTFNGIEDYAGGERFARAGLGLLKPLASEFPGVGAYGAELASAHRNLGVALRNQGKLAQALAEYRTAIDIQPDLAQAHCGLGLTLQQQGKFADALAALKRGHQLGSTMREWCVPSAQWVKEAERLVALDTKLPDLLAGKTRPASASEWLEEADFCLFHKHLPANAAAYYSEALAARPKLADKLIPSALYNGASASALASIGQGDDAKQLDNKQRARQRRQALEWLRAALALRKKELEAGNEPERASARSALQDWQTDKNLAGLRDQPALAKLPEAERAAWQKLWAEVARVLKQAARKNYTFRGPN
jgi:tetratricopeptide (TPR) repeat protein